MYPLAGFASQYLLPGVAFALRMRLPTQMLQPIPPMGGYGDSGVEGEAVRFAFQTFQGLSSKPLDSHCSVMASLIALTSPQPRIAAPVFSALIQVNLSTSLILLCPESSFCQKLGLSLIHI